LRTFWVSLHIELNSPLKLEPEGANGDGPREAVGFFQNFGVTAASAEDASQMAITQVTPSGRVHWEDSTVEPIQVEQLAPEVVKRATDWDQSGVWYRSGRIFVG
jgi:hypothetical protein